MCLADLLHNVGDVIRDLPWFLCLKICWLENVLSKKSWCNPLEFYHPRLHDPEFILKTLGWHWWQWCICAPSPLGVVDVICSILVKPCVCLVPNVHHLGCFQNEDNVKSNCGPFYFDNDMCMLLIKLENFIIKFFIEFFSPINSLAIWSW